MKTYSQALLILLLMIDALCIAQGAFTGENYFDAYILYSNLMLGPLQFIPALLLYISSSRYRTLSLRIYLVISVVLAAITFINLPYLDENPDTFFTSMAICYLYAHFYPLFIKAAYPKKPALSL